MNRTVVWCLCKLSFQWSQKLSPVTNFPSVTFWILFLPSPSSPPPEPLPLLFFHIYNPFLRCKLSISEVTWNYVAGSALKSKFIFYNSPLLKSYWLILFQFFHLWFLSSRCLTVYKWWQSLNFPIFVLSFSWQFVLART